MQIHISTGGQVQGPFTIEQINQGLEEGRWSINSTIAWYKGCSGWIPLKDVPGVKVRVEKPVSPPVSEPEQEEPTETIVGNTSPSKIAPLRIAGFVVGILVAYLMECVFLWVISALTRQWIWSGNQWGNTMPKVGCFGAVLAAIAGVACAYAVPELGPAGRYARVGLVRKFWSVSPASRLLLAAPLFWILGLAAFVILFDPFHSAAIENFYVQKDSHRFVVKLMFFPPAVFGAGYLVYILASGRRTK
jgi:hypothetical protein